MTDTFYSGRAGQLAVMAELLLRGWNVAMPEVDVGDDVFVVKDATRQLLCVQVKTSLGGESGYQFQVPRAQLENAVLDPLVFVFTARIDAAWAFLVFSRRELEDLFTVNDYGTPDPKTGKINFRVRFDLPGLPAAGPRRLSSVVPAERRQQPPLDLRASLSNWSMFPRVMHG